MYQSLSWTNVCPIARVSVYSKRSKYSHRRKTTMGIVIFTGNNNGSDDKINTSKISPNFLTFHSIHFSFSLSSLYRGRELFRIETRRQARSTACFKYFATGDAARRCSKLLSCIKRSRVYVMPRKGTTFPHFHVLPIPDTTTTLNRFHRSEIRSIETWSSLCFLFYLVEKTISVRF